MVIARLLVQPKYRVMNVSMTAPLTVPVRTVILMPNMPMNREEKTDKKRKQ